MPPRTYFIGITCLIIGGQVAAIGAVNQVAVVAAGNPVGDAIELYKLGGLAALSILSNIVLIGFVKYLVERLLKATETVNKRLARLDILLVEMIKELQDRTHKLDANGQPIGTATLTKLFTRDDGSDS